jgi:hypothetical protein
MRILKLLSVFLPAATLIGFIGVNPPVMAGSGDPPHDTHFVDATHLSWPVVVIRPTTRILWT